MASVPGAELVKVEPAPKSWVATASALPRKALTLANDQVKKRYEGLKHRYGPRYSNAMLGAAFLALFSPVPGSLLVGVALIVVIAEAQRAISRRGGLAEALADQVTGLNANMPCWAMGRWPSPPRFGGRLELNQVNSSWHSIATSSCNGA
jgi:hypothetical protein